MLPSWSFSSSGIKPVIGEQINGQDALECEKYHEGVSDRRESAWGVESSPWGVWKRLKWEAVTHACVGLEAEYSRQKGQHMQGAWSRSDLEECHYAAENERRRDLNGGQEQITRSFAGHGTRCRFYSKCDEKSQGLEHKRDMMWCMSCTVQLSCHGWRSRKGSWPLWREVVHIKMRLSWARVVSMEAESHWWAQGTPCRQSYGTWPTACGQKRRRQLKKMSWILYST